MGEGSQVAIDLTVRVLDDRFTVKGLESAIGRDTVTSVIRG